MDGERGCVELINATHSRNILERELHEQHLNDVTQISYDKIGAATSGAFVKKVGWLNQQVDFEDEASIAIMERLWKGLLASEQPPQHPQQPQPSSPKVPRAQTPRTPQPQSKRTHHLPLRRLSSPGKIKLIKKRDSKQLKKEEEGEGSKQLRWSEFEDEEQMFAFEGLWKSYSDEGPQLKEEAESVEGITKKKIKRKSKKIKECASDGEEEIEGEGHRRKRKVRKSIGQQITSSAGATTALTTKQIDRLRYKLIHNKHLSIQIPLIDQESQAILPLVSELKGEFRKLKGIP